MSSTMPYPNNLRTFADDLAAIAGPESLRVHDGRFSIAPSSTEEIAAVLRSAHRNGVTVAPFGGGTKQGWGNPVHPLLILHTHRLGAVREHTWQDMTSTVEAGCVWSAMQSSLAQHGQFVALDPLWPDRATVGGIAATNESGSLRLRYGSLRDLIIGMTIVLADGTIARSGGKVVKNVAGYDLHKLMTGAHGTLGIITEITFRLHSIPRHMQSFTISSPQVEVLQQLLMKILDSSLSTQSLQLRSAPVEFHSEFPSESHAESRAESRAESHSEFHLDVRLAAAPEVLDDQASSLAKLAGSVALTAHTSEEEVWIARQKQFDQTESFVVKATMLPSDISQFALAVHTLGGTSVTQAIGIMTASIPADASGGLEPLRQKLEALGGSLTILHHPANSSSATSTVPSDTLPLMRELKHRFDPNRILNPGRFVGGI